MLKSPVSSSLTRSSAAQRLDSVFHGVTQWLAVGLVVLVVAIALELLIAAIPAMRAFGLGFLVTTEWNPVRGIYGILPQIYGTLVSSLVAIALVVPLGIGIAVFLNEDIAPRRVRLPLSFLIELLAAIPSVVYGLWGIFILIPAIMPQFRWLHQRLGWLPLFNTAPSNRSLLLTILVLTLMILPIVVAMSRDALAAVPVELRQGAAALGATRWEIILDILIPASLSGIVGAAVLALGRAIGETMAAVMLIGNANQIQLSLLAPGSTIASLIANQFAEAKGLQVSALLYAALVLMGLTLILNVVANALLNSVSLMQQGRNLPVVLPIAQMIQMQRIQMQTIWVKAFSDGRVRQPIPDRLSSPWQPQPARRKLLSLTLTIAIILGTAIAVLGIGSILVSLILQGLSRFDGAAFTELPPPPLDVAGGFRNAITGTLLMVGLGAGLSAPLGIGVAVYLVEFGRGNRLSRWVRFFNGILSGVPSILCGLFAYNLVVLTTGRFSAVAGGVALAVVMVPMTVRTAEEGLKSVAPDLREGAIALGASAAQTIGSVVLPAASPAIATGVVLSIARAAGETAPLLFTALFSQYEFNGVWNPVASLSVLIYNFALSPYPNHQALAWTAALVVVGLILSVSIVARFLTGDRLR